MTDRDETSAPQLGQPEAAGPQPQPPTPPTPAENPVPIPLDFETPDASAAEVVPPAEPVVVAEPMMAGAQTTDTESDTDGGLPADLLAVQTALEQPTGAMPAVVASAVAAAEPAEHSAAELFDQIAPGTVAGEEPAEVEVEAAEAATTEAATTDGAPTDVEEPTAAEPGADGEIAESSDAEGYADAAASEGETPEGSEVEAVEGEGEAADAAAAPAPEAEEQLAPAPITKVSWWPFVAYVVAWLGVAGYAVWKLQETPLGHAPYETDLYALSMVVGLSMLAAGPALILIVWLASWIGRKNCRIGSMFISALVKGATVTLLGAIIWMGAIMLTDYLHLGRPF
jgi:hypothetical protein